VVNFCIAPSTLDRRQIDANSRAKIANFALCISILFATPAPTMSTNERSVNNNLEEDNIAEVENESNVFLQQALPLLGEVARITEENTHKKILEALTKAVCMVTSRPICNYQEISLRDVPVYEISSFLFFPLANVLVVSMLVQEKFMREEPMEHRFTCVRSMSKVPETP
jgi:hypothetical protein